MSGKLNRNNVRLHASQIPEFFSEPLKKFLTQQPDLNDDVQAQLDSSQKALELLQQQLSQAEKQRQADQRSFTRMLRGLQNRLDTLERKNHGAD